jgi:hypothetical protein
VEEGRVRLYRRHLPDTSAAQRLDLAVGCRLFVHDEVPWLQLALIDPGSTPPELVDTWLSHFELVDEAPVSRVLGERFEVQIVEVDERGRSQWQADLAAPLARNVVRIRQAAARLGAKKKGDRAAAIDAVRVEGADWLDRTGMPAFDAPEAPGSPAQVQRALVELTPWSTDDAEERLFVGRSVPVELVEGYRRRLLPPAIAAGLWLPPDLARRAVSDGLVPSAERLVAQLFDNFWTLTGHRHDVDRETMARNWLSLSHDAAEHGLAIEPRRQAFVQALLEEEGLSDTGAGPRLGPESAEGQPDLLLRWIGVDSGRAAAVGILLKMRAADFVLDLAAALDGLRAADLAESLIDLRTNEDLVAELFMAGLGAQRPPLRLASATGLGKLALRRAIVPLVHLLLRAGDEEWRFVGAAIAAYGATGAKAMEPMLADPRGREDRLAWTLASFHGAAAEKHVAAMTDSAELLTAAIARRAADWRNDVEQFRARLAESDGRTDAFGFVRLVRRILGEDPAEQLRAAIHDLRARGGVDI